MKKNENKNAFLITWASSVVLLLLMLFLGVNSSSTIKGTSAIDYASIDTCAVEQADYVSSDMKCTNGVVSGKKCCPTSDFTYPASGYCLKYYDDDAADFDNEAAKADCAQFGSEYTYYNTGYIAQCSGAPLGEASTYCINGAVMDSKGKCCPTGTTYNYTGHCVKSGWSVFMDPSNDFGFGAGVYVCMSTSPSSSSSSDNSSSNSSEVTCAAGQYYSGQGKCSSCPANYYCPGGKFNVADSSRSGVYECPSGTTSPAGSDSQSDCKSASSGTGAGCYCVDTEDGSTCENYTVDPGGEWTLSDDSNCSSNPSSSSSSSSIAESCWECNSPNNIFHWGTSSSGGSSSCQSGWHSRNDLTTKAQCSTHECFKCGVSQNYKYVWAPVGELGNNGSCSQTSYSTQSACEANNSSSSSSSKPSSSSSSDKPSSSSSSDKPSSSSSPESSSNVTENPPTGQITKFIVLGIALGAIVYSIWYFKKLKESK